MKKLLAALCVTFGLIAGTAGAAVETGKAAPDITFKDVTGAEHSLSGFKGKIVVLEWTNEGCPFVQKFYKSDAMQKLQADTTKDGDVVWLTINSGDKGKQGYLESDEAGVKFIADHGLKSTAYVRDVSGAFGKLYGAKTTPHMFVIDKEGVLAYQGAIDSIKSAEADDIAKATNYVSEAVTALRAGEKPVTSSSEPYGCGVKYAD